MAPEPVEEVVPDVAFVVPAPAYETIATDETVVVDETHDVAPIPTVPATREAPTVDLVSALGESLHRKLDHLQTLFEREIRAETTREKVVDRLHSELQEYKQDLLLNVLRPVFVDLIQLHDDIGKIVDSWQGGDEGAGRLLDLMRGFQQGIEDILYRQGVEPFINEGEVFDPRRQRAVSTVATDDPAANKAIAARLRKGFLAGEKVIRPEIVSVHSYKKPATS
ncbi:nucleotide exchange factor GrpE [Singulisphaera rosea]